MLSAETANREDDVSLEVLGAHVEPEPESSMKKVEPRDEKFQVLMRTSEPLHPVN